MFFLLCRLDQCIDDIAQDMQRSVNIASLFEPVTLDFGLFGSLAAGQIDNINFGSSDLCDIIFHKFRLNI